MKSLKNMEIDSTLIKVQDSESTESGFNPSKSTTKLIKKCMKCIGVLVQHVENVLSKSNGFIVNNSSKVTSNDGDNIDIVEHSVKPDPDDASRYLRSIKKCVIQIGLLCIENNIYVNCDLSFNKIDFYSCLDDSTRSLVINYLTENVVYLIEHIGFIINMFKQENDFEGAKDIRKSLMKIYKQIILIPLNSNLDETPEIFQKLDSSKWYAESMQNLGERLCQLRTALIKFKKTLKKKILQSDYTTIDDLNQTKRKSNGVINEPNSKKFKLENGITSSDSEFRVPNIPPVHKSDVISIESDTERRKKKKHKSEPEAIENITVESDTESVKKKKRHKIKSENNENESIIIESDSENLKKKHHIQSESDTESVKKKKKYKRILENKENGSIIIESDSDNVKKKHKIKSESSENEDNTGRKKKMHNKENETDEKENNRKERSINLSESSNISIGNLFTSQLEIGNEEISINSNPETNHNKPKKNKKNIETKKLQNGKKMSKKKNQTENDNEEDITHEIFGALSRGDLTVEYEDESENVFHKIVEENNLNENEKFLYLQGLLLEAKEKKKLSQEMQEKLKNLYILVDWEIPPVHQVESRLSAGPTPRELADLKKLGASNKRFNQDEDRSIRNNWKDFCRVHNLDGNPFPFLMFRHGSKSFMKYEERKKFIQFLGKDLPHRSLSSIYKRFKSIYRDKDKLGRFEPQEDELILTYCNKINSDKFRFSALAHILNRNRPAIERRYRTLMRHYNERVDWTLDVETSLVRKLLKATGSKDVEALKHAKITAEHYKKVADAMEIPWEKVRIQWLKFIYTKLFATVQLHPSQIRCKLVQLLLDTGLTDWNKIQWDEIVKHFEGFTKEFLWGQLMLAEQQVVPKQYYKDLGKVLEYLKEYIDKQHSKGVIPFSKKIIPRYIMTDTGGLESFTE